MAGPTVFIAGAAQHTYRDASAPHPAAAMGHAADLALADAGLSALDVDLLASVEPLSWNYPDLGAAVARAAGLREDVEHLWVPAGGTSPQDLLHKAAQRILAGEIDCALICGAESMRTRRRAAMTEQTLDWPERAVDVNPMRGQDAFSSELERRHGLRAPIQVFPLFENAIRARRGRSEVEQTEVAARLLAANATVAATNPHAWFRDAPTAEEIGTVSAENRLIAFPYTKRMNAILDVDQCAAVVVASAAFLAHRGSLGQAAAVLGGAGAEDVWNPIERPMFDRSPAMGHAIGIALERAGLRPAEIDAMDLYSCFPSAIQLALEALDADVTDARHLSLTGGLAFAGGPGNAYVLHSLAAALEHLRRQPSHRVLVTGIGMANTKHSATVLSSPSHVPHRATGIASYREPLDLEPCEVAPDGTGAATVRTWTIEYDRGGTPTNVILLLDLLDGRRTIANMRDATTGARELRAAEPVGRNGSVAHDAASGRNFFSFED